MALVDLFTSFSAKPVTATNNRVVGIDIGASSIKVVELQNRDNVITLTTYGELELGPYEEKPIGESETLTAQIERQALVDILRESAVKAKQAVFAMPLSSSFVTVMSLLAPATEDISPRVRVEARKYIPVPMAEVTLDWAEVEHVITNEGESEARDVLLAAIQNEALKRFTTLMQTVEFANPPIEIECFSAIRSLYTDDQTDSAIIDVGAVSTKMYIVRGGLLQRMYRVRAGGALYTEKLASTLKCTFEEAEVLKRELSVDHPQFSEALKLHQVTYDRVLKEFVQVIAEYETRTGTTVPVIQLIGGGVLFPNFAAYVSQHLNRPAVLAQPFNKVAYPAFMEDTMNAIGSSFVVALGAALRTFE